MQVLLNSIVTAVIVAVFGLWANSRLERLKGDLQGEMDAVVRKRQVYENLAPALRVFSRGDELTDAQKDGFYVAYDRAYIWASDDVLAKVNELIDLATLKNGHLQGAQEERNAAYDECLLRMRKDSGHTSTEVKYRRASFD